MGTGNTDQEYYFNSKVEQCTILENTDAENAKLYKKILSVCLPDTALSSMGLLDVVNKKMNIDEKKKF